MEKEKIDTRGQKSQELVEIINAVPSYLIRKGNVVILLIMGMLILLSIVITYPDTIKTEAIITTKTPAQRIFTKTTGKIDTIFLVNNQLVEKHQPIALIENLANYKDVELLKTTLENYPIKTDSIFFPIDKLPFLMLGEIDDDFSEFENSYIDYLIINQYKEYDIQNTANIKGLLEDKKRLSSLRNQKDIEYTKVKILKQDLDRQKELFEKGIISMVDYEKKQVEFLETQKTSEELDLSISQINNQIGYSNQNVKLGDIEKKRKSKQILKKVIQNYSKLKIAIYDWEQKYLISAERSGIVSYATYRENNDFVSQGELFVSVVPIDGLTPMVRLKSTSNKIGKILPGQKVNITLNNYPKLEYGYLNGVVQSVSLLPDEENFYLINVDLPNGLVTSYNKELSFKYQLDGTAEIITNKRSVLSRLLSDLRYLISKN